MKPDTWHGLDLSWHPQVRNAVKRLVEWYPGESGEHGGAIVLAGGYGCGKTHMANVVYRAAGGPAMTTIWRGNEMVPVQAVTFYPEPKLFSDIRDSYSDRGQTESGIIRRCQNCRILIIDDLGVAHIRQDEQKDSLPWAQDIYWRLIDPRSREQSPILITTNLSFSQLSARIGPRATDRLIGMMGSRDNFVDMFSVPSYRMKDWK